MLWLSFDLAALYSAHAASPGVEKVFSFPCWPSEKRAINNNATMADVSPKLAREPVPPGVPDCRTSRIAFAPTLKTLGRSALELSATSASAPARLQLSTASAIPTKTSTAPAAACPILTEAPAHLWPILRQALLPARTVDPRGGA